MTSLETTKAVVKILNDKKAEDLNVIKVRDVTIVSDYFVIASATNTTHVKSLIDEVEFQLKQKGIMPHRVEGYQYANWIILDYGDVVVHVFHADTRAEYTLDKVWSDGENIPVSSLIED